MVQSCTVSVELRRAWHKLFDEVSVEKFEAGSGPQLSTWEQGKPRAD